MHNKCIRGKKLRTSTVFRNIAHQSASWGEKPRKRNMNFHMMEDNRLFHHQFYMLLSISFIKLIPSQNVPIFQHLDASRQVTIVVIYKPAATGNRELFKALFSILRKTMYNVATVKSCQEDQQVFLPFIDFIKVCISLGFYTGSPQL